MVAGRGVFLLWYEDVKIISEDFDTLRLRLLDDAHSLTCWGTFMCTKFGDRGSTDNFFSRATLCIARSLPSCGVCLFVFPSVGHTPQLSLNG